MPRAWAAAVQAALDLDASSPVRQLPNAPQSVMIDGLPFEPWFTGDDFDEQGRCRFTTSRTISTAVRRPLQEHAIAVVVGCSISGRRRR